MYIYRERKRRAGWRRRKGKGERDEAEKRNRASFWLLFFSIESEDERWPHPAASLSLSLASSVESELLHSCVRSSRRLAPLASIVRELPLEYAPGLLVSAGTGSTSQGVALADRLTARQSTLSDV